MVIKFKYGFEDDQRSTITLYYYYNASVFDKEWPIPKTDKIDYIVYKDYSLSELDKTLFKKMNLIKPTTKVFATEYKLLSEWYAQEEDISNQEFIDVFDVKKKRLLKMYNTPYRTEDAKKTENKTNSIPANSTLNIESENHNTAQDQSTKPFFRKKAKKEKKDQKRKKK